MPGWHVRRRSEQRWTALVCLLPAVAIFGVFNIVPTIWAARLALLDWNGMSDIVKAPFIWFDNYLRLCQAPEFWNSLVVTVEYSLGVTALGLITGLLLAMALNRRMRGRVLYRVLYFTPEIASTVAAGIVWYYLFLPNGLVNKFLHLFGIAGPSWLSSSVWALPAIIVVGIWKRLGFNMVVYLAALQGLPVELYEAAEIDGAGPWHKLIFLTVPLLKPTTLLLAIMSLIDAFQVFALPYTMTQGGPMGATEVMGLLIFREARGLLHMGYAAAMSWVIFAFVFAATLLQWRVFGKED